MNIHGSILIATDFSDEARWAERRGAFIAKEAGLRCTLCHVLPASLPTNLHISASTKAQEALGVATEELRRVKVDANARLLSGDVAEELAKAAQEFDLIIVGSRVGTLVPDFSLGR